MVPSILLQLDMSKPKNRVSGWWVLQYSGRCRPTHQSCPAYTSNSTSDQPHSHVVPVFYMSKRRMSEI